MGSDRTAPIGPKRIGMCSTVIIISFQQTFNLQSETTRRRETQKEFFPLRQLYGDSLQVVLHHASVVDLLVSGRLRYGSPVGAFVQG